MSSGSTEQPAETGAVDAPWMERLVAYSVRHYHRVLFWTAVATLAASFVAVRLQLDALPDLTSNQVLVLTRANGLTPEEVERRVTIPIEVALGGVPGLIEHRSLSRYGISSITTIFEDDVDPYRARQLVQERLTTIGGSLPAEADAPELGPLSGGLGEIFHIALSSPVRTTAELLELAQYKVTPLLRAVPGVVEVNSWGGQRRTLDVIANPVRLAQRGLTMEQLRRALELAAGAAAGASLENGARDPGRQRLLRAVALPLTSSELAHAIVSIDARRDANGGSGPRDGGADRMAEPESPLDGAIRVADVAEVREGSVSRIGAATANGRGEIVYLMAQMLRGANALEVMERIHAQMAELQALLPQDVRIEVAYDRSLIIHSTLRTVGKNLLEGGLLVVLVLFALLGSLRAGLIVAAAIPLSMLGAAVGMVLFGVPGNLMSLGALDFGLVVDGSVVVVEQIFHAVRPKLAAGNASKAQLRGWLGDAARSVARPTFFGVLIIALVYLPVLTMTGVDGKMFRPMALTVVFALATSLVISLTVVPAAASAWLGPGKLPLRDPWLARMIDRAYPPVLRRVRRFPGTIAGAALALMALGGLLFARSGSEFAPELNEGDLVIQTTRDPSIQLDRNVHESTVMELAILELPEVDRVYSRIGSPAVATDIMGVEQSDVFVRLRPAEMWRDEWRSEAGRDQLIEELRRRIDVRAPNSEPSFTQPIQMRFNELLAGAVTDVTVSVFGDDLAQLRTLCLQVAEQVRRISGAVDVRVLAPPDVELLEVRPRALRAAQQGFHVSDALDAVRSLRAGIPFGVAFDGPVRVPLRLKLGSDVTSGQLAELPMPTSSGGLVPLGRVADIEVRPTPSLINHHNGLRRLLVGFNVRGADLGQVVASAQTAVRRALQVPRGYRLSWGGQYEVLQAATRRLSWVIPTVLVLILGLLVATFGHLRPSLIIFSHVPFAGVGGMLALALRGLPVSMSAAVGFIALSGIAVLNGVVLMTRIVDNEASGMDAATAALRAAEARVRPVLMTAFVAALGFLPMVLAHGVGAEVQRPLATVVVGGLITSTALTVLILPTLYPYLRRR